MYSVLQRSWNVIHYVKQKYELKERFEVTTAVSKHILG
jgi:hypothetical protein